MNSKRLLYLMVFVTPLLMFSQSECNCCTENHAEFDFWVGSWVVTKADGSPAGVNLITKEENECVIKEQWTSANNGFTGTSLNFFNTETKQWE